MNGTAGVMTGRPAQEYAVGHIRLGTLPRTRRWAQVVALIGGGASAPEVANATVAAAERRLRRAAADQGVLESVWLLMQLPLAARSDDFASYLRGRGVNVSDSPGLMEVIGAVADAIDARLANNAGRTDLGEMAQMAAAETLAEVVGARTKSLFGTTPEDVRQATAELGTVRQFGAFARHFFARLTYKCLDYFLSRALADHVGEGRRFTTLAQQGEFTQALETHCNEAAAILERFSGEWFSKERFEAQDIQPPRVAAFTGEAMKKLISELKARARPDGP
jgi:hypothetical protein